jgi:hypothetical protein
MGVFSHDLTIALVSVSDSHEGMSPTPSTDSASDDGSAADDDKVAAFKSKNKTTEQEEMNEWVSKTSLLDDVVFSETE